MSKEKQLIEHLQAMDVLLQNQEKQMRRTQEAQDGRSMRNTKTSYPQKFAALIEQTDETME